MRQTHLLSLLALTTVGWAAACGTDELDFANTGGSTTVGTSTNVGGGSTTSTNTGGGSVVNVGVGGAGGTIATTGVGAGGSVGVGGSGGGRDDWLDKVPYRHTIDIPSQTVGDTLLDFPVGIVVDKSKLMGANPVRFYVTEDDGKTVVPVELEAEIQGHVFLWFRATSLSPNANNRFYLYYGAMPNSTVPPATEVWSNGFASVVHCAENPANNLINSVTGLQTVVGVNMEPNDRVMADGAKFGYACRFNSSAEHLELGNVGLIDQVSVSIWARAASVGNGFQTLVANSGVGDSGFRMYSDQQTEISTFLTNTIDTDALDTGNFFPAGPYTHVALNYDITGPTSMAVNGAPAGSITKVGAQLTGDIFVGALADGAAPWNQSNANGYTVDEVRISSSVRSPDWIAAEYANQNAPNAFSVMGPAESGP